VTLTVGVEETGDQEVDLRASNPKVEGSPVTVPRLWGLQLYGVDIE